MDAKPSEDTGTFLTPPLPPPPSSPSAPLQPSSPTRTQTTPSSSYSSTSLLPNQQQYWMEQGGSSGDERSPEKNDYDLDGGRSSSSTVGKDNAANNNDQV